MKNHTQAVKFRSEEHLCSAMLNLPKGTLKSGYSQGALTFKASSVVSTLAPPFRDMLLHVVPFLSCLEP